MKGRNLGCCLSGVLCGQSSSRAYPLLCDRASVTSLTSKVRNALDYALVLCIKWSSVWQSVYNTGSFVPFLPILPFFEISHLDEAWKVNAFKYISHPLFFCNNLVYSPSQNTWIRSKIKGQKYHVLSWLGSRDTRREGLYGGKELQSVLGSGTFISSGAFIRTERFMFSYRNKYF